MLQVLVHRIWGVMAMGVALAHTGAAAAETRSVTLDAASCRTLTRYIPDADVSAAYQPGIDAHGEPVAPADIGTGAGFELPETFTFDIEVSLFAPPGERLALSTLEIARVRIASDGRAYLNDRPLQDAAAWALAERCREIRR